MIGNANDEINFTQKLLLTNRQVSKLLKAFANNRSAVKELSNTQLSKIIQLSRFLGRLLGPLLQTGLPLMKNVPKPIAKSVLIQLGLGLTTTTLAADVVILKKLISARTIAVIISNEEMGDVMKIIKFPEESRLLI